MRKVLVLLLVILTISAYGQVSQLNPTAESKEKAPEYLSLRVFKDDELIACWESQKLETILTTIVAKHKAGAFINWGSFLANHDCAFVQDRSVVTVTGMTADGNQIEDIYKVYEYDLDGEIYNVIRVHVDHDLQVRNSMHHFPTQGVWKQITATGDVWIVSDFLPDVSRRISR